MLFKTNTNTNKAQSIRRNAIVAFSALVLSLAAPAASQASSAHHRHVPAAHSGSPYTRAVVISLTGF